MLTWLAVRQIATVVFDAFDESGFLEHFEVETPYLAAVVKGTQFRVTIDGGKPRRRAPASLDTSGLGDLPEPSRGPVGLCERGSRRGTAFVALLDTGARIRLGLILDGKNPVSEGEPLARSTP